MGLEVHVQPAREAIWVQPVGELDLAAVAGLRKHVDELIAVGFEHVVIDLRGLSFMDVAGLRLLLSLATEAQRAGWRLSLIQGCSAVRRVFALTDMLERLPFVSAAAA
jgi:anti-anti-sigma factor